jgi:hypothetical protein
VYDESLLAPMPGEASSGVGAQPGAGGDVDIAQVAESPAATQTDDAALDTSPRAGSETGGTQQPTALEVSTSESAASDSPDDRPDAQEPAADAVETDASDAIEASSSAEPAAADSIDDAAEQVDEAPVEDVEASEPLDSDPSTVEEDSVETTADVTTTDPAEEVPAETPEEVAEEVPAETRTVEPDPAPTVDPAQWVFDDGAQGFIIGQTDPASLADSAVLGFNSDEGYDAPGALMLEAPFSAAEERIWVQIPIESTDMSGLVLSAQVCLVQGMSDDPSNPSTIKVFAKSGESYVFASGAPVQLIAGEDWTTIDFDLADPDYVDPAGTFDPSDVREVGFELNTGYSTTSVAPAIVYLDDVRY